MVAGEWACHRPRSAWVNPQRAFARECRGHSPFSRQLFQEPCRFHALSGAGNTSTSEKSTGSWVNTAERAEVFLGLSIPNCNTSELAANVETVQLNISVDVARALWLLWGHECTFENPHSVTWALTRSNRKEQDICNHKSNCLINLFFSSLPIEM